MSKDTKTKLTLSIDEDIIKKAKKEAEKRHIPVSRLVENYLKWLSKPDVYCFSCSKRFNVENSKICTKCGWLICPDCKACRCTLSEETSTAIFQLRKTLEDLVGGRLK